MKHIHKLVGLGAIGSAIVASACCLGPFILLLLGISGAWISHLSVLEAYSPLFMALAVCFLILAFYKVYFSNREPTCKPGSYCDKPKSDKVKKIGLWIMILLTLGLMTSPYILPHFLAGAEEVIATKQVVLIVQKMTCILCTVTVKKSLMKVKGVKEAKVTLIPNEAIVTYDPKQTQVKQLMEATTKAGYPSSVKPEKKKD